MSRERDKNESSSAISRHKKMLCFLICPCTFDSSHHKSKSILQSKVQFRYFQVCKIILVFLITCFFFVFFLCGVFLTLLLLGND